ncbi:MAG TPA: ABC transporter substrate-binding protein [Alphaproteobacteria bacterium]|nr:ABC transporter substrate-binding protein [Alphaproteobacteria bacterium]
MYLDFLVNGYHSPFYLAAEKGWYKEAGLDVTVLPGKGTADSIKTVGTGNAEFGFPDYGAVAKAVSDGLSITAVAAFVHDTPAGIVSFADKPIKTPKDLEGKSLSVAPFGATAIMLPAFVKLAGVDMSKVKTVTYNFGAMVPSFLTGKVDATIGYYFGEYLAARTESKDRPVIFLRLADFGIKTYANGIVVNNDFMAKDPKAVAAFVKTSVRALQYTFTHVDEAVAATAKHTETPKDQLKQQLVLAMELMDTPEARKAGYGRMTAEKWDSTQKLQVEYGEQKSMVPNDKLWTNKFLE